MDTRDDCRPQRSDCDGVGPRDNGEVLGNRNRRPVSAISISLQSARLLPPPTRRASPRKPRRFRQCGHAKADANPSRSLADLRRRGGPRSGAASWRDDLRRGRRRVQGRQHPRHGARARPVDCTGAANPLELRVGQVITRCRVGLCVHATTAGAEYAIVPFYDSGVPSATTQVEVRAQGVVPLPIPVATIFSSPTLRNRARTSA